MEGERGRERDAKKMYPMVWNWELRDTGKLSLNPPGAISNAFETCFH